MILFEVLYLALPAFVANMAPVVATRLNILPALAVPIDSGVLLRGKPLLGKNKMWRGVIVAVGSAIVVAVAQYFSALPLSIAFVPYESLYVTIGYGVVVGVLVMRARWPCCCVPTGACPI